MDETNGKGQKTTRKQRFWLCKGSPSSFDSLLILTQRRRAIPTLPHIFEANTDPAAGTPTTHQIRHGCPLQSPQCTFIQTDLVDHRLLGTIRAILVWIGREGRKGGEVDQLTDDFYAGPGGLVSASIIHLGVGTRRPGWIGR